MTDDEKIRALESIAEELDDMAEDEDEGSFKVKAYQAKLTVQQYTHAISRRQKAIAEALTDRLVAMAKGAS